MQLLKNVTCAPDAIPIHQIFDCQRCAHIIGCNLTHILTRRGKICTQIPFRIKNRESLRLLADNCSILWENVLVKLPLRKIHTSKKCLDRRNHRCISWKPIEILFQLLKGALLLFLSFCFLRLPLFKTFCCIFLRYTHKWVANILMRGNKIKRNIIFFTVVHHQIDPPTGTCRRASHLKPRAEILDCMSGLRIQLQVSILTVFEEGIRKIRLVPDLKIPAAHLILSISMEQVGKITLDKPPPLLHILRHRWHGTINKCARRVLCQKLRHK